VMSLTESLGLRSVEHREVKAGRMGIELVMNEVEENRAALESKDPIKNVGCCS